MERNAESLDLGVFEVLRQAGYAEMEVGTWQVERGNRGCDEISRTLNAHLQPSTANGSGLAVGVAAG